MRRAGSTRIDDRRMMNDGWFGNGRFNRQFLGFLWLARVQGRLIALGRMWRGYWIGPLAAVGRGIVFQPGVVPCGAVAPVQP